MVAVICLSFGSFFYGMLLLGHCLPQMYILFRSLSLRFGLLLFGMLLLGKLLLDILGLLFHDQADTVVFGLLLCSGMMLWCLLLPRHLWPQMWTLFEFLCQCSGLFLWGTLFLGNLFGLILGCSDLLSGWF